METCPDASTRTAYLLVRRPDDVVIGRCAAPRTSHSMRVVNSQETPIGASVQACQKRLFSWGLRGGVLGVIDVKNTPKNGIKYMI